MDLTQKNAETIQGIRLVNMSVDQMVAADGAVESRFHKASGVWWREVKPFFYQPAQFLMPLTPGSAAPCSWRALGGYYHVVPPGENANGALVTNELPCPAEYDISSLRKTKRYMIRRALSALEIKPVPCVDDMLGDGYKVYLDWEKRTGNVRVRRSNPNVYRRWAVRTFAHPYNLILGAYSDGRLAAWTIAKCAEGVADLTKAFSHSAFHHLEPTSALIYAYIRICGNNPEIHTVCDGLRSLKPSLETYKRALGFTLNAYPAWIHLPALVRPLVRRLLPMEYNRLMGNYEAAPMPRAPAELR